MKKGASIVYVSDVNINQMKVVSKFDINKSCSAGHTEISGPESTCLP